MKKKALEMASQAWFMTNKALIMANQAQKTTEKASELTNKTLEMNAKGNLSLQLMTAGRLLFHHYCDRIRIPFRIAHFLDARLQDDTIR